MLPCKSSLEGSDTRVVVSKSTETIFIFNKDNTVDLNVYNWLMSKGSSEMEALDAKQNYTFFVTVKNRVTDLRRNPEYLDKFKD